MFDTMMTQTAMDMHNNAMQMHMQAHNDMCHMQQMCHENAMRMTTMRTSRATRTSRTASRTAKAKPVQHIVHETFPISKFGDVIKALIEKAKMENDPFTFGINSEGKVVFEVPCMKMIITFN